MTDTAISTEEEFVDLTADDVTLDAIKSDDEDKAKAPKLQIPDKFKADSLEEAFEKVINSYNHLEKEMGRKNNEVGELRRLADSMLEKEIMKGNPSDESATVTTDDLLDNPEETLYKAIANNPIVKNLTQKTQEAAIATAKAAFEAKHPDYLEQMQSGGFLEFLSASPVRMRLFQEANANYDYDVGDELLSTYKALEVSRNEQDAELRREQAHGDLKKAAVETGAPKQTRKKIFKREDIRNLMIHNKPKYKAMEAEIRKAYQEGRVR